jgi:preprotein translocase subunit SecE
MNRETKRMMQRQGQMEADGSPSTRRAATATQRKPARQRVTITQWLREIREELRQVAWPTRPEMVNYTSIVLVVLVIMIVLIFFLNFVAGKWLIWLFEG